MFKNRLLSILYNGLPENSDLKDRSRAAVLNSISIISVFILTTFTIVDIINSQYIVAIFTGLTAFLISVLIIIVGITKKISIGTTSVSYIAFLFFSSLIITSGEERAGYFWLMLLPLVSIFFLGIYHGTIVTFLFGILSYYLIFFVPNSNGIPLNHEMGMRVVGAFIGVSLFTIAFELIRRKAFSQLEDTTSDLVKKRKQTTTILSNVKQGIFVLNEKLEIGNERSTYFNELFIDVKDHQSFMDIIKGKINKKDFMATKDYLELFFNKTVNPILLKSINPIEKILFNFSETLTESPQVWLEFDFERVLLDSGDVQILGLFRNITNQVLLQEQLEREENESQKNMENLFQIIHINSDLMDEFIKDSLDEITSINDLLKTEHGSAKNILNFIFQKIHSIKGNAMLLGLNSIANKLLKFENCIKEFQEKNTTWRELLKLTVNLAELKKDIMEIEQLISKIISFQARVGSDDRSSKYILEETLKKSIKKLGDEYNISASIDISKYNIDLIPEKYRRLYKDSINQFIRNSFAHGFESKDDRIRLGKTSEGTIYLSLEKIENKLLLKYRDDGRGLSISNIKKAAIKKGYDKDEINSLSDKDTIKLIFESGFSTTENIDNLSGQGVGMNVIKSHIDKAGGKLKIKSSAGKYCEFQIVLNI